MGEIRSDDAPTPLLAITTPAWTMSPWRTSAVTRSLVA
jgi:hypothetical protein